MGFPSELSGFVLTLLWSLFLCGLRLWSGGVGLVILVHVVADITIGVLVLGEKERKERAEAALSQLGNARGKAAGGGQKRKKTGKTQGNKKQR